MVKKLYSEYGLDKAFCDSLLIHGYKPFVSWYLHSIVNTKMSITEQLRGYVSEFGLPIHKLKYLYFYMKPLTWDELSSYPEWITVINTLQDTYYNYKLWSGLLPFAFKPIKKFVAERMLLSGVDSETVAEKLCLSKSTVYLIRRSAIERELITEGTTNDN